MKEVEVEVNRQDKFYKIFLKQSKRKILQSFSDTMESQK